MNLEFFDAKYPLVMSSLRNARKSGRFAHAHLLVSSNPDYRMSFPALLAAFAACQQPLEDGAPCQSCETCRQILDGTYPDVFLLAPSSKSRQITIGNSPDEPDTLRWFESLFHLSSLTRSGWKIGVVQDADTMNESAQNAFLKTLEEPPQKCIFILTTGRPSELLPTIRSRCQAIPLTDNKCVYKFPRCPDVPEILLKLQFHSKGDLVKAQECADALIDISESLKGAAAETVKAKWEKRLKDAENLEEPARKLLDRRADAEATAEYRRMREQFISMLHAWFAQVVLVAEGAPKETLPNPEIMEPFLKEIPKLDGRDAAKRLSMAEELMGSLRTNVNDELALRAFCLNIALKN
jgi:DNA polymerase-3 subunit delta'